MEKEYLQSIYSRYSSRLLIKDVNEWERINLALMKVGATKTIHCNTCGAGQREIWNELVAWIGRS